MKCTRCGFDNPYDAHYCKQCGTPLEAAAPQGQAGPQYAAPPPYTYREGQWNPPKKMHRSSATHLLDAEMTSI